MRLIQFGIMDNRAFYKAMSAAADRVFESRPVTPD
jgi:hypothetical protein